jgi:hypothetical protein
MDGELRAMLERQAEWQRSRADRPWAEKLREAVVMRRAIAALRKKPGRPPGTESHTQR